MKTILLTLTYLVGAGELILAIYFWATNSKNEIRRVLGLFAFATALWGLTNTQTGPTYDLIGALPYIFGSLSLVSLLHFTIIYPSRKFAFDKLHALFLYLPWGFFSYLILCTKTVITDIYTINNANTTVPAVLFSSFNLYLFILFILSLSSLFWTIRVTDGNARKYSQIIFWSILIGGLPGIFFAVFHFMKAVPFNYLYGPLATAIWLGAATYIVRKK